MSASDPVRKNPVGYGPFKIKSMVPGEAVEFVANEDYFRGAPKLDGVHLKVVNPDLVKESLKTGEIDMIEDFPTSQYDVKTNPSNLQFLGRLGLYYAYIGFKLGKYDKDKGVNVMDDKAKMSNKSLRQAMGYAINTKQVSEQLYHGLRFPATTLFLPLLLIMTIALKGMVMILTKLNNC